MCGGRRESRKEKAKQSKKGEKVRNERKEKKGETVGYSVVLDDLMRREMCSRSITSHRSLFKDKERVVKRVNVLIHWYVCVA